MDDRQLTWLARRTWHGPVPEDDDLSRAKRARRVSVVLPALDERETVGTLVAGIEPLTGGTSPLVDELVVADSGSTDDTREIASRAGARVVRREDVLPGWEVRPGKGEVLWRALALTTGDLVVLLDSDLVDVDADALVRGLLAPLLLQDGVSFVKGYYRRPLRLGDVETASGGGRVTELLVRPLLAALRPELGGIVQPLGGEYAATRDLLESLPFAPGYGVEIGLLMDTVARLGLDAVAQVDLGVRKHRNRSLNELGVMSRQILESVLRRCDDRIKPADPCEDRAVSITQFAQQDGVWTPERHTVEARDRPPMRDARPGPAARP